MIYTVTFNPSLDYIVSVDDFKLGLTNRTSSELMLPGGKGINVSIVLKNLGIQSTALGFMAGFTGKEIARRLEEEGVTSDFIQIEEGISRINLKLKSIDGTEINGSGPKIPKEKVEELMKQYPGSKFINVKDNPLQVVKEIAKCRYVLSSSLHGLIVADSFHIPNMYLVFGDRLLGDGYKFDDYYSAYGITQKPRDLRTEAMPELSEIEKEYQILPELVEEKKRQMREAFPYE